MRTYAEVDKGLAGIIEYLKETETAWNKARTLKLYDVSFKASDIIKEYPRTEEEYSGYDLFSWFCDDNYEQFIEWMHEDGIDDCRNYIGRTSTFYLTDLHSEDMDGVIETLMDRLSAYHIDVQDGRMEHLRDTDYYTEAELLEEYEADMDYVASGEMLGDVKKYLSDAVQIAEYIDDFMENQIDIFKEYISMQEDFLESIEEQEQAKEQDFISKYGKAIDGMTAYIKDVMTDTGCTLADARHIINNSFTAIEGV